MSSQPSQPSQSSQSSQSGQSSQSSQSGRRPRRHPRAEHPRGEHQRAHADSARTAAVVSRLVGTGLVEAARAEEAREVVRSALAARPAGETPLRRRLAEVAGYVGGALVVAAAVVFLTEEWGDLSTGGRIATLAAIAIALLASAAALVLFGAREAAGREAAERFPAPERGVRRRLASALGTGGAVAAAFAVGVFVADLADPFSSAPWSAGGLALVVGALGVYVLAPSALGQVAMAAGAGQALGAGLDTFWRSADGVHFGVAILGLGVLWLVLAELGLWWERHVGLALGCGLLLLGAQFPVLGGDDAGVGYALTAAVAVAAVVVYTRTRTVPYLVAAVAGITLAVPETLLEVSDGSLGPVGVLLATGLTLLVAGLLGLRLRRGVGPGSRPGAAV